MKLARREAHRVNRAPKAIAGMRVVRLGDRGRLARGSAAKDEIEGRGENVRENERRRFRA